MAELVDGLGVLREVRARNGRTERGQVDLDGLLVLSVGVGLECGDVAVNAALDVVHRLVVHRENAVLRTGLDRHVADGEAVVHGQLVRAFADELHRLVQRAVHADLADNMQDDVLAGNPRAQLALENELDRARHLEPCLASRHACREVGRANAGRERAQRAVGAGVAVRADDQLAGSGQTFFREQRMLDAHCADVEEVNDVILLRKLTALQTLLCGLDVLVRSEVIHYEGDLGVVEYLAETGFFHLADGNRAGNVVRERQIDVCFDELSCGHAVKTCVLREDFLRHSHTHNSFPPADCD